jgi:pimeloyl-ACP methyl ester carboxylesterase
VLLFLHGFPEGAFIWDGLLEHFAQPAHGGYRCVAPYLRGFGASSSPTDVAAYRPKFLVQDLAALIAAECGEGTPWNAWWRTTGAAPWPGTWPTSTRSCCAPGHHQLPHPGAFVRELQHNAAQQAASQYMHFLCRPDAEAAGRERFPPPVRLFQRPGRHARLWLTEAVRQQYRALWQQGLTGACNYYRASPLRPPREGDLALPQ